MIGKITALGAAIGLVLSAAAWADPPQVNGHSPLGAPRGVATEVTINGNNLAGNPQLIAPFEFIAEPIAGADASNAKLKLTVSPGAAVGVYPVRIKTDDGISNPFLLAVGQVPQVAEKEDNSTFEAAQPVPSPAVVEGQAAGNDVDFFKFPGKKGQRIVVDAQCARIGSGVDPTIRLTTAARTYVASADDSPGLMTDARLVAVLPEDTDYVVEISDSRYQGGGKPVYRLVIGPIPVADEVYPLGGRRGETVGFELRGGTLPDVRVAAATLAASASAGAFRLQVPGTCIGADPNLELETAGPLAVGDLPEVREPADPNAPPLRVLAPATINGRIDPAGDEDRFVVAVTPGKVYRIRVEAAELGSALDGTLQVLRADGGSLAQADDTTTPRPATKGQQPPPPLVSPDPSLNFTVPGGVNEITLALRDLEGRGGAGFPYRVTVEPVEPTFQVALGESQVSIPKGGTAAVGVTIARKGYNGPIALAVADPPPGLSFRPGTIAEGQAVGAFSVSAAPDAAFGPITLKVVGTGQGPSGPIVAAASKEIVFAQQSGMPTNSWTQVGLPAAPALPRPATLEAPESVEVVHGFVASIPLKVARQPGAEGALTLAALPLPPGVTVPAAKIDDKAAEGAAKVEVATTAPLGTMTIALTAKGKLGGKDQTLAVPAVTLNVVRPAALELAAPSAEVKPGATVEVKGKVVRREPFKEPVTVKLNGLPAGLKADPVTVAPDAAEFTLKLVADPGAAAATATAQAVMAFQVAKKDYATPPTPLAIKVVK
jgi:hypothetical protein